MYCMWPSEKTADNLGKGGYFYVLLKHISVSIITDNNVVSWLRISICAVSLFSHVWQFAVGYATSISLWFESFTMVSEVLIFSPNIC